MKEKRLGHKIKIIGNDKEHREGEATVKIDMSKSKEIIGE